MYVGNAKQVFLTKFVYFLQKSSIEQNVISGIIQNIWLKVVSTYLDLSLVQSWNQT